MPDSLSSVLTNHSNSLALVIGNGVNRYPQDRSGNSWNDLLKNIARKHLTSEFHAIPEKLPLTEFYDLLELQIPRESREIKLQEEFCNGFENWQPLTHHKNITEWAQTNNRPILTTNFDQTFASSSGATLRKTTSNGFTDFYPWSSYFGHQDFTDPTSAFGIWHINGMLHYKRSIRLGHGHYMGSVNKARGWIHQSEDRLFSGKNTYQWPGYHSWLNIIFNSPLLILGLNMGNDEVFLRWLLIERAKFFKLFPEKKQNAWYVQREDDQDTSKNFFLKGVGITPINVDNFKDIYEATA